MRRAKIIAFTLVFILIIPSVTYKSYSTDKPVISDPKVMVLNQMNILKGTNNGLELDRVPLRVEGAIILVRLLGKEQTMTYKSYNHPFTDVPKWADQYIGYLYQQGLVKGKSDSVFGTESIDISQFLTFVLRALGYDDARGDFRWNTSLEKALEIGLLSTSEAREMDGRPFLRKDAALIAYNSLKTNLKAQQKTLLQHLVDTESITISKIYDLRDSQLTSIANTFSHKYDSDGDGLSDFEELFKYFTNADKSDTSNNGVKDGDWQERREYTYSIKSDLRIDKPVNIEQLSKNNHDVRIIKETDDYYDIELYIYPFNTIYKAIKSNPIIITSLDKKEFEKYWSSLFQIPYKLIDISEYYGKNMNRVLLEKIKKEKIAEVMKLQFNNNLFILPNQEVIKLLSSKMNIMNVSASGSWSQSEIEQYNMIVVYHDNSLTLSNELNRLFKDLIKEDKNYISIKVKDNRLLVYIKGEDKKILLEYLNEIAELDLYVEQYIKLDK